MIIPIYIPPDNVSLEIIEIKLMVDCLVGSSNATANSSITVELHSFEPFWRMVNILLYTEIFVSCFFYILSLIKDCFYSFIISAIGHFHVCIPGEVVRGGGQATPIELYMEDPLKRYIHQRYIHQYHLLF